MPSTAEKRNDNQWHFPEAAVFRMYSIKCGLCMMHTFMNTACNFT